MNEPARPPVDADPDPGEDGVTAPDVADTVDADPEPTEQIDSMAIFPLGSVLLPGMALPLQIFEPRYRVMMFDLRDVASPEFGVVLIERGSEVGGGETRSIIGCRALIAHAEEEADGTWAVIAVGTDRIRVDEWLEDDPYPRARVTVWADSDAAEPVDEDAMTDLERTARRVAGLAVELGARGQMPEFELSPDPGLRVYQLAIVSPLGALDRSRILACPTLSSRVALLSEMLGEQEELLQARLSFGE